MAVVAKAGATSETQTGVMVVAAADLAMAAEAVVGKAAAGLEGLDEGKVAGSGKVEMAVVRMGAEAADMAVAAVEEIAVLCRKNKRPLKSFKITDFVVKKFNGRLFAGIKAWQVESSAKVSSEEKKKKFRTLPTDSKNILSSYSFSRIYSNWSGLV
jgi:hypothetical protein